MLQSCIYPDFTQLDIKDKEDVDGYRSRYFFFVNLKIKVTTDQLKVPCEIYRLVLHIKDKVWNAESETYQTSIS